VELDAALLRSADGAPLRLALCLTRRRGMSVKVCVIGLENSLAPGRLSGRKGLTVVGVDNDPRKVDATIRQGSLHEPDWRVVDQDSGAPNGGCGG